MCLTGVDYFSTLGYQPGIAALAAGILAPVATLVLVVVTLAAALPMYRRVAEESPRGEGSISMLERLMSYWKGKFFVLALLGFAATDFLITMTLSAADATAHLDENPFWPSALKGHEIIVTLALLTLLGAIFLRGFTEAIGLAVVLVGAYLSLNVVVVVVSLEHVLTHIPLFTDWRVALVTQHGNPAIVVALAILAFPRLALGLSGFETGVVVMPHIKGAPDDDPASPAGRIRGTHRLLTTSAIIMSVFLLASSLITTVLIPPRQFQPGGAANGRALAYLAHKFLGNGFGTVYDASTIAILWFAGASAMAGLLNLVPRYLPRYGMAPDWARATRPLVLVFTGIAFFVTIMFRANVDAQGGAYATGVLVLFTSAAVAVTLSARRRGNRRETIAFAVIAVVFAYTTVANIIERPDGLKIGSAFVAAIITVSILSRLRRAFEIRATGIDFDPMAARFIRDSARRTVRLVANRPEAADQAEYRGRKQKLVHVHGVDPSGGVLFVEIELTDPSDFEDELHVSGQVAHDQFRVLRMSSASVPAAMASLALAVRDATGVPPHLYFDWTEGNPARNFIRYILFGQGEVAPVTREILREAEPNKKKRPRVHVG